MESIANPINEMLESIRSHGNQPLSHSVTFQDRSNLYIRFSPVKRVPVTANNLVAILQGLLQKVINDGFAARHADVLFGDPPRLVRAGLLEIEN